ncbi:MAG: 4-hydroxy-3-methylbut-2-enyl diphosphate reductase, partial [Christensenellales bacterium]
MKLIVARHAGFCFGVKRAVEAVHKSLETGSVYTYGPIIHNEAVVAELEAKGAKPIGDVAEISGGRLVIRSHGAPRSVYSQCEERGIEVIDAT